MFIIFFMWNIKPRNIHFEWKDKMTEINYGLGQNQHKQYKSKDGATEQSATVANKKIKSSEKLASDDTAKTLFTSNSGENEQAATLAAAPSTNTVGIANVPTNTVGIANVPTSSGSSSSSTTFIA